LTISSLELNSLNFAYQKRPWEANLATLLRGLDRASLGSVTLAPELCLTGYAYKRMDEAASFGETALAELLGATKNKTFGFTCIAKKDNGFVNRFYLLDDGKVIYTQDKAKLFPLGDEPKYFIAGDTKDIKTLTCKGLKIGVLICFELRFPELWLELRGCDLILVPALWGKPRKSHFETLCDALAIANQCYVLSSNSSDLDMASGAGVIDPFGVAVRDDRKNLLTCKADLGRIKTMRRYIKGVIE
jgi:predicted amidohydrolase